MKEYRRWQCAACRYQVSLTAGTILHNTKTPLTVWFWAAYLTVTDTRGMSALLFQRQLGLRRYETAWMLLHKLRRAMVNAAREPLHGEVEIDDTWIGGPQAGLRGSRQLKGRHAALVLVAVEKRGAKSGRVRMAVIPDFKTTTLTAFIQQHVVPGSTIYTDGLKQFTGLPLAGFKHVARAQPLRGQLRKELVVEVQAGRRRGDRARMTRVNRLVTLAVARVARVRDVGRQRHLAVTLEPRHDVRDAFEPQLEEPIVARQHRGAHATRQFQRAARPGRMARAELHPRFVGRGDALEQ